MFEHPSKFFCLQNTQHSLSRHQDFINMQFVPGVFACFLITLGGGTQSNESTEEFQLPDLGKESWEGKEVFPKQCPSPSLLTRVCTTISWLCVNYQLHDLCSQPLGSS